MVLGGNLAVNIGCNLIADWIWMLWGPDSGATPDPHDTVHVRVARKLPDGTLEMIEARGSVGDVVHVLREQPAIEPGEAD